LYAQPDETSPVPFELCDLEKAALNEEKKANVAKTEFLTSATHRGNVSELNVLMDTLKNARELKLTALVDQVLAQIETVSKNIFA
jgi:hypothetical protein